MYFWSRFIWSTNLFCILYIVFSISYTDRKSLTMQTDHDKDLIMNIRIFIAFHNKFWEFWKQNVCWVIFHFFFVSYWSVFLKNYFRNTISECQTVWIQIRLDKNVGPDLDPNSLQSFIADDTSRQRVNKFWEFLEQTVCLTNESNRDCFDERKLGLSVLGIHS